MDKVRLKVDKDELTIEEGENTFLGKLIEGTQGTIRLNTSRGMREIHKVKDKGGRVFKDDKGDIGKPKKGKKPK